MVFSATLGSVAEALVDARQNGAHIQMVLDKLQTKDGQSKFNDALDDVGIAAKCYTPGQGRCVHHKVGIFNGEVVSSGSFSWTNNAQKNNYDNLVVKSTVEVAGAYRKILDELWEKASPESRSRVERRPRRSRRFVLTFLTRRSSYEQVLAKKPCG